MKCCPRPDIQLLSEDGWECLNCGRALGHRPPEPVATHAATQRRRGHLVRDGSPLYAAACDCGWESEGLFIFASEAIAAAKVLHLRTVNR